MTSCPGSGGVSSGGVAGIVIGCTFSVAAIALFIGCIVWKKQKTKVTPIILTRPTLSTALYASNASHYTVGCTRCTRFALAFLYQMLSGIELSQSPQQGTQDEESISNEDLRRTSEHFPMDQSGTLAVTLESLLRRYFKSFYCCCSIWCTCTQYTQSHRPYLNCNMCEGIQTIPTSMCRPVNRLCLRSCQLACADLLLEY